MTYPTLHLSKIKIYFFLIIFFHSLGTHASAITSQCSSKETIVFTCSSGKKIMSICSSHKDAPIEYVEYRYATGSKKPSFTYRSDISRSKNNFNRASVVGSSSESTIIWFENFGYTYVVNDPVKGIPSVSVWNSGSQVAENQCTGNFGGDSETSHHLIKEKSSDDYFDILRKKK